MRPAEVCTLAATLPFLITGAGNRLQESHMLVVQAERETEMYLVGLAFNLVENRGTPGSAWHNLAKV